MCLRDVRHFAELDSLFYKVQSEARFFIAVQECFFDFCGCVITDLIAGSEDLPAILSCFV